ncbi:hypothetical protein [Elizabethkingia sp. JS20170427COW]|uniref:hypothetical protein n=1 Tax=Elizabethkingia sp. JS20170427COW TaxID=2583851 RepID=UPI001110743B|nr:hypothetical protein [Elizabethkingia sp. JS20170427COW]QCX54417.1 hypothetical protein FGE20_12020 [Elizabethkingia sp. JS20170427COW]
MKVSKIIISKLPKPNFKNKILNFLFSVFMVPFAIFLIVFTLLFITYDFIKTKIFGIKDKNLTKEDILFENQKYKIVKEYFEPIEETEENKLLYDFYWNIAEYDDELYIFKLIDKKLTSELNNCYVNDFKIENTEEIFLQKIIEENQKINTYLIAFNKETGKVKILTEIGHFSLYEFDKKRNLIKGFNKKDQIKLQIEQFNT